MSLVSGLEKPCGTCGRVSGDHTLREWAKCMGTVTTDLPFERVPDDMADAAAKAVREQFSLDPDLIVADGVVVKAVVLSGDSGAVEIKVPALLHEFQINLAAEPPAVVAKVAYLGDAKAMRGYGRLVRDNANGAANAAEE